MDVDDFSSNFEYDENTELYRGRHPEKRKFCNGVLPNFDLYTKIFRKNPSDYILPDCLLPAVFAIF